MSKCKHVELMKQYLKDAQTSEEPWKFWSEKNPFNKFQTWRKLEAHPTWNADMEYRRDIPTIEFQGIERPSPVGIFPEIDVRYYYAMESCKRYHVGSDYWENTISDRIRFYTGNIFRSEEEVKKFIKEIK